MKLLLDENLPVRLKYRFDSKFTASTVSEHGWSAKKDSEILNLCQAHKFDAFITADKNLIYQQNLKNIDFLIIVLNSKDNRYNTLLKSVSGIEEILKKSKLGVVEVKVG